MENSLSGRIHLIFPGMGIAHALAKPELQHLCWMGTLTHAQDGIVVPAAFIDLETFRAQPYLSKPVFDALTSQPAQQLVYADPAHDGRRYDFASLTVRSPVAAVGRG